MNGGNLDNLDNKEVRNQNGKTGIFVPEASDQNRKTGNQIPQTGILVSGLPILVCGLPNLQFVARSALALLRTRRPNFLGEFAAKRKTDFRSPARRPVPAQVQLLISMKRLFFFLLMGCLPARAQLMNNPQSGVLATCLTSGANGELFAGTDNDGLFRRDVKGQWAPFAGASELGDKNVTCVVADAQGRLWVGTASAGLSVWTQEKWTHLGRLEGPLSARVNDLKVAVDGAVWGATDAGLFRWTAQDGWTFPGVFAGDETTRDLARRPVYALALDKTGRVLEATDDGLNRLTLRPGGEGKVEAIGRAPSDVQPARAEGDGFLPGPVHAVALDTFGHLWCATRWGVCESADDGKQWTFLRGRDWQDNARGSAVPLQLDDKKASVDLLGEDWVTTLAPTPDGKMWLGFRSQGAEERDGKTLETLFSTQDDPKSNSSALGGNWVSAILPFAPDQALFARYGGGLFALFGSDMPVATQKAPAPDAPAPDKATFSPDQLKQLGQSLDKRAPLPPGSGAFYSLDRETRGDWPLRYGNDGLELTGMMGRTFGTDKFGLNVSTGPHRVGDDEDLYYYTHENNATNPNSPQVPLEFQRRTSEINDGTWQDRKYPMSFDGPDLWVSFSVPDGLFRTALYWFNADGLSGANRMRDYRVALYAGDLKPQECLTAAPLARARLWSGWNGEFASFAVRGPGKFQIRIARDRSFVTKLQGVFFDQLGSIPARAPFLPANYVVPVAPTSAPDAPFASSIALWQACDRAETRGVPAPLERLIALRAAQTQGAPADLLRAWRVQAALWDERSNDRKDVALPVKTQGKTGDGG